MNTLAQLILNDLIDMMLDNIIVHEVQERIDNEMHTHNRQRINGLTAELDDTKRVLNSTKSALGAAIQESRNTQDLYNELKILYDARVTNDVLRLG